jgi:hypothetical protein
MSECKLCREEATLRNSHIISEFYYKPIYDIDKKRFYAISSDEEKSPDHHQKGLREKLLCDECEIKLSKWERYFANLLFKKAKVRQEKGRFVVVNADYKKIKLHQLSIIWRSSISSLDAFKNVALGPHEERIRKMIRDEEPGRYDQYGCALFVNMEHKKIMQKLIIAPKMKKYNSHRLYNFILGGIFWSYFISSHTPEIARYNVFVNKDGELPVTIENKFTSEFLYRYYSDLKKSGNIDSLIQN